MQKFVITGSKLIQRSYKLTRTLLGIRSFPFASSSPHKGQDKLRKLKKSLDNEISYEESQLLDYSSMFSYFQKHGWNITDFPKSPMIRLSKSIDNRLKAHFIFKAKSPTPENQKMTALLEKINENKAAKEDNADTAIVEERELAIDSVKQMSEYGLITCLYVTFNDGNSLRLIVRMSEEEIHIMSCAIITEPVDEDVKKFYDSRASITNQVEFENLEDSVKESINEFMSSLGLDLDFSVRVQQLSMAKDQKLYYEFLKRFSDLVDLK